MRSFDFTPPGTGKTYFAVAAPVLVEKQRYGVLVVATPKDELRDAWLTLMQRLGLAFLVGIVVSGALGWYLSRRITRPVLALADAADEIAAGHYDVELPPAGEDEIGDLTRRFGEMARRLSEAEELERNFLMTVSHELRTPLTAIRGHVGALREGLAEDPELRERSLEVIAHESTRLERLVGDVLDLAKLDAHRFTVLHEEVDMRRLLEQAYEAFGEEARRRSIDYRSELTASPVIVSDGDRVLQIISNLLSNAFRWTPDGGRVDLGLSQANGLISVAVEDTGPGIAARGTGAHLPAVRLTRRRRNGPRARDRARARGGARRPDQARERAGAGEPVRAGAAGASPSWPASCPRGALRCGRRSRRCRARSPARCAPGAGRRPSSRTTRGRRAVRGRRAGRAARRADLALEPLEPPDRLAGEAAHLRHLPRDGQRLRANAVADGVADPLGKRGLEVGGQLGELLDLRPARARAPRRRRPPACAPPRRLRAAPARARARPRSRTATLAWPSDEIATSWTTTSRRS